MSHEGELLTLRVSAEEETSSSSRTLQSARRQMWSSVCGLFLYRKSREPPMELKDLMWILFKVFSAHFWCNNRRFVWTKHLCERVYWTQVCSADRGKHTPGSWLNSPQNKLKEYFLFSVNACRCHLLLNVCLCQQFVYSVQQTDGFRVLCIFHRTNLILLMFCCPALQNWNVSMKRFSSVRSITRISLFLGIDGDVSEKLIGSRERPPSCRTRSRKLNLCLHFALCRAVGPPPAFYELQSGWLLWQRRYSAAPTGSFTACRSRVEFTDGVMFRWRNAASLKQRRAGTMHSCWVRWTRKRRRGDPPKPGKTKKACVRNHFTTAYRQRNEFKQQHGHKTWTETLHWGQHGRCWELIRLDMLITQYRKK